MDNAPLVSIVVITYNSGKHIIETLDSFKNQTYNNIELIITDDNSTDDTISLSKKWVAKNMAHFKNIQILESKKNTGIVSNLNRGLQSCQGEWIKFIGGDDLLFSNSVKDHIDFINNTDEELSVICSRKNKFSVNDTGEKRTIRFGRANIFFHSDISANHQFVLRLRGLLSPPYHYFIRKKALEDIGYCDEKFPMYEDRPMEYRLLKKGIKFHWLDSETFLYRVHDESISHKSINPEIYNQWKIKSFYPVFFHYEYPHLNSFEKGYYLYQYLIVKITYNSFLNRMTKLNLLINKLMLAPFFFIKNIHDKIILRRLRKIYQN